MGKWVGPCIKLCIVYIATCICDLLILIAVYVFFLLYARLGPSLERINILFYSILSIRNKNMKLIKERMKTKSRVPVA